MTRSVFQPLQRGVTLIEALVAMVIMAFGMVALVGLMGQMRRTADVAKQRGEAVRIAQRDLELQRDYSVLELPANPPAGVRAYAGIATEVNASAGDANSNATYTLQRTVTPWFDASGTATGQQMSVSVTWLDRANSLQTVQLQSFITRADPGLGGALGVAPTTTALRGPSGHVPVIPIGAKDVGEGTSAFKPQPGGTLAWIFNNLSGAVIGRCTVPAGTPTALLTLDNLGTCDRTRSGLLLSGYVRFSDLAAPDSSAPSSAAAPLDMMMNISVGSAVAPNYECYDDAPFTRVGATATSVSYYCVVYPDSPASPGVPNWSGKLWINAPATSAVPGPNSPWSVCRYSGDYNGDGSFSNAEHPLKYNAVTGALTSQNFLLVPASASCPTGHVADPVHGVFADTQTVLHQTVLRPEDLELP